MRNVKMYLTFSITYFYCNSKMTPIRIYDLSKPHLCLVNYNVLQEKEYKSSIILGILLFINRFMVILQNELQRCGTDETRRSLNLRRRLIKYGGMYFWQNYETFTIEDHIIAAPHHFHQTSVSSKNIQVIIDIMIHIPFL